MRTQQGQAVLFWICLTGILNKGKGRKKKKHTPIFIPHPTRAWARDPVQNWQEGTPRLPEEEEEEEEGAWVRQGQVCCAEPRQPDEGSHSKSAAREMVPVHTPNPDWHLLVALLVARRDTKAYWSIKH